MWAYLTSKYGQEKGTLKNDISASSTSFRDQRLQTSLDEGITHANGLGVGWSANMGDFNPFLWNLLKVHHDFCNKNKQNERNSPIETT